MQSRVSFAVLAVVLSSSSGSRADDETELQNYRLTMPVVKKLVQVQENLFASVKRDPSLATRYKKNLDDAFDGSLDAAVKKFDSVPELKQAIAKAGLTTREYLLATLGVVQAGMASAMTPRSGPDTRKLPGAIRANMKFMEENRATFADLQKRLDELDREAKKLTGGKRRNDEEPADQPAEEERDKQ